ncbi:MAG: 3-deoxy-8-phosphooctulonate synthase [Elusimicrobia bacterium]|nr:3-deoxy-8-phosphooctulonate synthase [Elusimicrobiota bacterium]
MAGSAATVRVGGVLVGNEAPLAFIAGLCVLESERMLRTVARGLKEVFAREAAPFILKCSFDKANRTSLRSFRGPGARLGLSLLKKVASESGVPVLTDVHEPWQAELAAEYVDALQVPAFLCRQTDLLVACGRTMLPVNVKKGQFLSPLEMARAVEKIESTGNDRILLTERGTFFGYGDLVVDMRSLAVLRGLGHPVVFDATHSVQFPASQGPSSGGDRRHIWGLSRAAVAAGVAAVFVETHPRPDRALSDGPNSLPLGQVAEFVRQVREIDGVVKKFLHAKREGRAA